MHTANRVAVNTGILYIRMAITVFISLYSTRLILNALGASDFGIFNLVGGAILMLTFLNNAMTTATQRFMSFVQGEGNEEKQKSIFNVSLVIHFLIGIIIVILLEGFGYLLFNSVLKIDSQRIDVAKLIYHFLVVSTFVKVISVPYDAVINAHENMLFVAILGILEALLRFSIALFVTYTNYDKLLSYGFLMAALAIMLLIVQRIYCHKKYIEVQINIRKFYNRLLFIEMSKYAGWSFLGSAVSMIGNSGQGIVTNMFFGTVINAAQGVAGQINGQLSVFSTTMLKALTPVIVKSEGANNREMMLRIAAFGSKMSFFLIAFIAIPALIEMPYIMNIWLKDVPEYSIIFCRLLIIKTLIENIVASLPTTISAIGNIRNFQISMSTLALMPLPISYLLFKLNYSPTAMYLVFMIQAIFSSFILIPFFVNKLCGLPFSSIIKNIFVPSFVVFGISAFPAIIPLFFMPEGIFRLLIVTAISLAFFIFSVKWIGLSKDENQKFETIVNSGLKKCRTLILKSKN